jgi:hypothetical protein
MSPISILYVIHNIVTVVCACVRAHACLDDLLYIFSNTNKIYTQVRVHFNTV